jgi:hypothetical protein
VDLRITSDVAKLDAELKKLGYYSPKIANKILRAVVNKAKARVKRMVYRHLNKGTGELKKRITTSVRGEWARIKSTPPYIAQTLEYGKTILPVKRKYLTFKDKEGKWIRTKKVVIKPHPYFFDEIQAFLASTEYQEVLDKTLAKEIQRLWEKQTS